MLPCLIFEDDYLLVVNKPAGLNTHAPGPYAGEGLYDWLRHREPRWAALSIIHRLDKETSGILIFSKNPAANRSLTEQFTRRTVRKKYLLLTDRTVRPKHITIKTCLVRAGEKYLSRPLHAGAPSAETKFKLLNSNPSVVKQRTFSPGETSGHWSSLVEAIPITGRTHQIRVHAAEAGFPVLGDTLYGGTPAPRVYLHAAEISFHHPFFGKELTFSSPPDFEADPRLQLRHMLGDSEATNAYRLIHGASDGLPGVYVDRLGDRLLAQSARPVTGLHKAELERLMKQVSAQSVYLKSLTRQVRQTAVAARSPQLLLGGGASERITVLENGLKFELSFNEGYSVGLFLDQRDNRRRLLMGHVAADFPDPKHAPTPLRLLNTFAYTCGFSVCAAKAGFHTTSLDLSPKYLEWGKRNFHLNDLNPAEHDFIHGDVFEWLRRLGKKGRSFHTILLDPPTFSQSKTSGTFRVEKDYDKLVKLALPLLERDAVLFTSSNAAGWTPESFRRVIENAVTSGGRTIRHSHYFPQPPDFPISRAEHGYLKTLWLAIGPH